MKDNIDNLDDNNKVDLELKKIEYRLKEKELESNKHINIVIPILSVVISFLGSYFITYRQIEQNKAEFNTSLIENIMDDEVLITKRKIEFLFSTGVFKENKEKIATALNELCNKSAMTYFQRAQFFLSNNDNQKALENFDIAIELDKSDNSFYINRAKCNRKLFNETKSKSYLKNAILDLQISNKLKENHYNYYKISEAFFLLRNYKKSAKNIEEAIKMKPKSSLYYIIKGKTQFELGDLSSTCESFKKANQLKRFSADKYINNYCN